MKFLLDENMPPSLAAKLNEIGYECRHVLEQVSKGEKDVAIFLIAEETGETIITHDLDFSALHAFSGKKKPSIILFRIHHINAQVFFQLLNKHLPELIEDIEAGAFIVVEESAVRVRRLPIRSAK